MIDRDGHYTYCKTLLITKDAVNDFTVLPNPFNTTVNITCNLAGAQSLDIQIVTVDGKAVFTKNVVGERGSNSILLNVENLKQGFYFLKVRNEHGDVYRVQKLVKLNQEKA